MNNKTKSCVCVAVPTQDTDHDPIMPPESGQLLKAAVVSPGSIIARLPERWIDWLHDNSRWTAACWEQERNSTLRSEFAEVVISRLFPRTDTRPLVRQLRDHSCCTAVASEVAAEFLGLPNDVAFLCGLLHDMGIASAIRHIEVAHRVADVATFAQWAPTVVRASVQHAIHLAMHWRLPSQLRFVIRELAMYSLLSTPSALTSATLLAEHLANALGYELDFEHGPEGFPTRELDGALSRLGIDGAALAHLRRRVVEALVAA